MFVYQLAKEVSVRLHDELDLMEDRRGKVEEENRHITELLEQADRKQFRLELEVDKLRDKVSCLSLCGDQNFLSSQLGIELCIPKVSF